MKIIKKKKRKKKEKKKEDIPRLNSAAEPQRCRQEKGGKTAERSLAVALNDVDSLSLPNLVLFSSFHWVLDVWIFLSLY